MTQDTISVLLVEDNPTDALLVSEELRGSTSPRFVLSHVERLAPALQRFATETFNVILLDLGLPDSQGLDTLHAMCRQAPETPIIVLTGLEDEARAIRAVQSGAQDYLPKREVQGHLIRAIRYSIERKRAEERTRLVFEASPNAMMVVGRDGKISLANAQSEKLFGYSRDELIGMTVESLMPERFRIAHAGQREVFIGGSHSRRMGVGRELLVLRKDGVEVPVEIGLSSFQTPEGDFVLASVTDITERLRAEAERKRMESQLMRSERLESIGTLAGGIAHDLNNLLTPIIMGVDLLGTSQDPMVQRLIRPLQTSASTAIELVKQVLIFARGGQSERQVLEVGPVVDRLIKLLKQVIPRNIEIRTSLPDDLWPISGDPTEIHQVVLNLCINSRDAMPNGGQLSVGAENKAVDESYAAMQPEAKPGQYVEIQVSDTGTGIPPEVMGRIFEPFFTTKEPGKGTGLGLATVSGIVKSYGGFVEVKSDTGRGTIFSVYLPAAPTSVVARDAGQRKEIPRGKGETVLVIDDEATVREMLHATLDAFGYHAHLATDGADGVALFAQYRDLIDAVIVDMMMPVMDGVTAVKSIRRIDEKVPIISASGLRDKAKVMEAMHGQVQAYIAKPFSAEQLLTTLHTVLANRRG